MALGFTYYSDMPTPKVEHVYPDGQAARLGMMPGDVLLSVNGMETADLQAFKVAVAQLGQSSLESVVVLRGANRVTLRVGAEPVYEAAPSTQRRARVVEEAPDFEELMLREMQEQTKVLKETRGAVRAGFWFLAILFVVIPLFNSCALQAQQHS